MRVRACGMLARVSGAREHVYACAHASVSVVCMCVRVCGVRLRALTWHVVSSLLSACALRMCEYVQRSARMCDLNTVHKREQSQIRLNSSECSAKNNNHNEINILRPGN